MNAVERWYQEHQRTLPWRRSTEPYPVWVSEIMLQQTRVETVLGYYDRFLARFPGVRELANGTIDDVLMVWQGLGYYSRARNLHKGARVVFEEFGGEFPTTLKEAMSVPGIGRSTAGSILSICFGTPTPVMDGNVKRVLARRFGIAEPLTAATTMRTLWNHAEEWIHEAANPGDHNQGLMDLGATVCTPTTPHCHNCPVASDCVALRDNLRSQIPARPQKKVLPHHHIAVGVLRNQGQILIQRRRGGGLLGGLWEFPGGHIEEGENPEQALAREFQEELGVEISVGNKLVEVKHAYSHFRITLHVFWCSLLSGTPKAIGADEFTWEVPENFSNYPWPAANARILRVLKDNLDSMETDRG